MAQTGQGVLIRLMPVLLATVMERTTGCWPASLIATAAGEALYRSARYAETNGCCTAIFIRSGMLARSRANLPVRFVRSQRRIEPHRADGYGQ